METDDQMDSRRSAVGYDCRDRQHTPHNNNPHNNKPPPRGSILDGIAILKHRCKRPLIILALLRMGALCQGGAQYQDRAHFEKFITLNLICNNCSDDTSNKTATHDHHLPIPTPRN